MLTVIVTRNPNIDELAQTISYIKSVLKSKILIVDNNSTTSLNEIISLSDYIIINGCNMGLAKAYNIALKFSNYLGEDWLLLLDQDSKILEEFDIREIIEEVSKLPQKDKVAIISLNKIFAYTTKENIGIFIKCKSVVNSGSILNVKICSNFKYNEDLFIDRIDNEYCYRLRKHGYLILAYPRQLICHKIGDKISPYKKKLSKLILFLLKTLSLMHGFSEFKKVIKYKDYYIVYNNYYRYYTIIRNTIYLSIRSMIDKNFLKTLPSWLLALYEETSLIVMLKLFTLALFHGLIGDLKRDNERIFRYFQN
ncbi:glycosyl transferase family 2 [Saccharolobus caldissimus]|uniref:Glycosyl transferase family 2 n=1 Tax=Saccharolobus caldissimus TaxID=1702097 RepID=A0AAQ4CQR0_9CREN|nr:glycosyl transferase family 2 [Saccharolobus caldissimus]